MQQVEETLCSMVETVVVGLGYELVGIDYRPNPRDGLLRIYIDAESGIDVDDCAVVSRQISGVLDVEDPIPGHYTLEISSPGLDRPLFKLADYDRFSGCKAKIQFSSLVDGKRKIVGVIKGTDGDEVLVESEEGLFKFIIEQVHRARLIYEE